jgi:hypothetical protein
MTQLVLYTRSGCCLCEGLEEKLRALQPPVPFDSVDVDTDRGLQARYGLRVPVLALRSATAGDPPPTDLPAVPPRLSGQGLRRWLDRHGVSGGATP